MKPLKSCIYICIFVLFTGGIVLAEVHDRPQEDFKKRALGILKDDCANCHGFYRMGGLGPPLTPQRLKKLPIETIEVLISEGVPGKFMPPWKAILTKKEIWFLAQYLQNTPTNAPKIKLRKTQTLILE